MACDVLLHAGKKRLTLIHEAWDILHKHRNFFLFFVVFGPLSHQYY